MAERTARPETALLTREIAGATLAGVRSPLPGYPADGLDPVRLAAILRQADQGDATAFLDLAETIEERDPHYLGVLATRKRSVAQLELKVEAASDAAADLDRAEMVRAWLARDELAAELFDILDSLGKGVSFTEIIWEKSAGQWRPVRLEWRDPRWFRLDRRDLATPLMLAADGSETPLPPFKFIAARIAAKSGLPLRGGLARVAAWAWMFKAYTQRDWAIFTQTYGQPLRLGRYGAGASEADRDTLFRAVANIAGDCAAIVPESMQIEFVQPPSLAGAAELYERRADWLDRQVSKAVLGQTTTTDAVAGGHAVSREHRLVQEDIERADARALTAILNRDLVRPWVELEWGPQPRYPRLALVRPEAEDIERMARTLALLVPLGLRVETAEVRDRLGLADPAPGAETLAAPAATDPGGGMASLNGVLGVFKGGPGHRATLTAPGAEGPSAALPAPPGIEAAPGVRMQAEAPPVTPDAPALLAARLEAAAQPAIAGWLARIEAILAAAGSLEEAREMLLAAFPDVDAGPLAEVLGQAMTAAHLAGRAMVAAEAEGADGGA